MSTKFLSHEGFDTIKSIDKKKRTFSQKFRRASGKISKEIVHDAKVCEKKINDITWRTLTPKKFFKGIRNFHIKNSYFEFMRTPKGIVTALAPVCAALVLVLTVCFWTCNDSALTVNVDGEYIATIENEEVLTQASAQVHSALSKTEAKTSTVPVMQVKLPSVITDESATASDVYEKLVDYNAEVVGNLSGLYVDGVFFGATADADALSNSLTQILETAKSAYGEAAVATFNNDVKVETDVFPATDVKPVDEIINTAKSQFSVRVEEEAVVENKIPFETIVEKDDTLLETDKKVKVEGVDGSEKVCARYVYVDGELVETIVLSKTTISEPVDEVVIQGTKISYEATGEFLWPVPYTHYITSPYGPRWGTIHRGIDIADSGVDGQDIVASDSGTVSYSNYEAGGYGNYFVIDHGNGFRTLYAHCSAVYVSVGDKVRKGDLIASVGTTGNSTGPHLHFEIIENDIEVDPEIYVS